MMDLIDLIIKLLTLFFLAGTSQMAFKNRQWAVMMVTFGLWLTVFRTAILRATVIYLGVFNHLPSQIVSSIQTSLMGGAIVSITDFIALIGAVFAFILYTGDIKKKV